jgi:hypothetical protein
LIVTIMIGRSLKVRLAHLPFRTPVIRLVLFDFDKPGKPRTGLTIIS